jgi:hypothetical protein
MFDAELWARIVPRLQQLPGGASLCERIRDGLDPWPQIAEAMSNCTAFPAAEFGRLLASGDFDVRWPLTFAAWYSGASGASVDNACRDFLVTTGLWQQALDVLPDYCGAEWLLGWRTEFEKRSQAAGTRPARG